MVVRFNDETKTVQLSLDAYDALLKLEELEINVKTSG